MERRTFGSDDEVVSEVRAALVKMREHSADGRPNFLRNWIHSDRGDDRFIIRAGREVIEIYLHGPGEVIQIPSIAVTEAPLAEWFSSCCGMSTRTTGAGRGKRSQVRRGNFGKPRCRLRKIMIQKSAADTSCEIRAAHVAESCESRGNPFATEHSPAAETATTPHACRSAASHARSEGHACSGRWAEQKLLVGAVRIRNAQ